MRGGKREGAGRPSLGEHQIKFVVPDDIWNWLQQFRESRNMSKAIQMALREFMNNRM